MLALVAFGMFSLQGDLDALLKPVDSVARQASSYDRASVNPATEWFANGDYGKYIRDEVNNGRAEHVMAELTGPGEVNRIWSANPQGTIRFYFDGETTPRIEVPMKDLLTKTAVPGLHGYEAARGCNVYGRIPYAKSLKITLDEGGNWKSVYYHVGSQQFTDGRSVTSFDPGSAPEQGSLTRMVDANPQYKAGWIRPDAPLEFTVPRLRRSMASAVLQNFSLKINPSELTPNFLRGTKLEIFVDGERTVVSPLGDFFGTASKFIPYESAGMMVNRDGTMTCRFQMPFTNNLRVKLSTRTGNSARVLMSYSLREDSIVHPYVFRAQWSSDSRQTRPMYDMTYLNANGEGRLVGVSQHIENPAQGWWGEGDEKIYVDGEKFPSFFGTGTEDFLGYAWCSPELYARPYHGQQRCDTPITYGHSTQYRWFILDSIPFRNSMKFDVEMWHWIDCHTTCNRVVYWYSTPGSSGNHDIAYRPIGKFAMPEPVKGAIEGEKLKVLSHTGGTYESQGGFPGLSNGQQLWWKGVTPGMTMKVEIPNLKPGRYRLVANLCHARDYGKHRLRFDSQDLGEHEFFDPNLQWKKKTLGTIIVRNKTAVLEITCTGINPQAQPGGMFGLDYLLLEPAQ